MLLRPDSRRYQQQRFQQRYILRAMVFQRTGVAMRDNAGVATHNHAIQD